MTRENGYNMPPKGLFGKRCRIKHCLDLKRGFVYRIVNDGVKSNTWRELPLGIYGKEPVQHDTFEDVVFVVCDTLIDESSKIEKVALKDIEIIEEEPRWIPVSERMPEDSELVLFSTKTDRVFEGRYFADNTDRQWYSFRDEAFAWNNVVTAWMPLPKPYEPESEVKNESLHDESNG